MVEKTKFKEEISDMETINEEEVKAPKSISSKRKSIGPLN